MTHDIVVCSLERWDEIWRRNQFLVRELLGRDQQRRILFVEPPADLALVGRRRGVIRGWWHPGPREVGTSQRLWALRPLKLAPRRAGPWVDSVMQRQVVRAARSLDLAHPVLWVNDFSYAALAATWRGPVVYDVTDDWLLEAVSDRELRRRLRLDAALTERAEEVIVCSAALAASRGASRDVRLIPNGVDLAHFASPRPRPEDMPPAPTAVYVGTLQEERLDVDLCLDVARSQPDLHLCFIGPVALQPAARRQLSAVPNICLLGARPYDAVPAYLQHADVVIIPHKVTPFTESLDPIKAYECLAVNRPCVATPVAGFRELGERIRIAARDEFGAAVESALGEVDSWPAPDLPSWAQRAAEFDAVLGSASRARDAVPIRVMYLDHCARLSGGEIALLRLLPALNGVDATVILAEEGPLVERMREVGAAVRVVPLDRRVAKLARTSVRPGVALARAVLPTVAYTVRMAGILRAERPDVVHTNSLKSDLYGGVAARLAGVPVVWHLRDRISDDYLPPSAVRLLRLIARIVPNAIIANSATTASTLGRSRPNRRVVIYNALPASVINDPLPAPVDGTRWRSGQRGPLKVGIVGRLAPWKGQDVFLRALALAGREVSISGFVVGVALFGEDDFAAELERLASDLGLGGSVAFRGWQDDVGAELAGFDVLVHASVIPEPFGQVVAEGMAAGLVVVASDEGGPAELIRSGVNGILVRPNDAEALAKVLIELAADPKLRAKLGANARRVVERLSPATVARSVQEVYERLIRP